MATRGKKAPPVTPASRLAARLAQQPDYAEAIEEARATVAGALAAVGGADDAARALLAATGDDATLSDTRGALDKAPPDALTMWRFRLLAEQRLLDGIAERSRIGGSKGGKRTAAAERTDDGLTPVQAWRAQRYATLTRAGHTPGEAIDRLAADKGCSTQAIRQSLRLAGVNVSTKARQGKRRSG